MAISVERIRHDLEAIAAFTETPGRGASRPTFSAAWRDARDYVMREATLAACKIRVDAAGNVHARPESLPWDAKAWLCGSHVDTVPHGGDYDGVTGVVVPLEILRAAREDNSTATIPLELVIFAEEEGTTFGLGMLGSRTWAGTIAPHQLAAARNAARDDYLAAGAPHGVDPDRMAADRILPEAYRGLIEVHIEQGPGLWKRGVPLAVVTAIAGRRQYRCALDGVANHAGSTSMMDRHDALVGAATLILQLEGLARGLSPQCVITVGRIESQPNAVNVIPGHVEFTIDFRSPDAAVLDEGDQRIRGIVEQVASKRGLKFALEQNESLPPVEMDLHVCAALERSAEKLGMGKLESAISGALHDAAILAPLLPTAMLFVPSRDGISHNPAEFSRVEDIAAAARVVYETVRQ